MTDYLSEFTSAETVEESETQDYLDEFVARDAETAELTGLDKLKQGAAKFFDVSLDDVTPELIKDYQAGGFEGMARGRAKRSFVPGADIFARTVISDEDLGTVLDEEVGVSQALTGVREAVGEIAGRTGGLPFGTIANEIAEGAAEKAVSDAVLHGPISLWGPAEQAAVEDYERMTGRRWVGPDELKRLKVEKPGEWRKIRNSQSTMGVALLRGIPDTVMGLGHLAGSQYDAIKRGEGVSHAGTTLGTIGGTILEDLAQTSRDPQGRLREDPFGMVLDLAGGAGDAAAVAARARSGVVGAGAKAAAREARDAARPLRSAGSVAVDLLDASVPRFSKMRRELTDAFPDAPREIITTNRDHRWARTGEVERLGDLGRELAKDSSKLEDLFGSSANDLGIMRVVELGEQVAARKQLLQDRKSLGMKYNPDELAMLESVKSVDDLARLAGNQEALRFLDSDVASLGDRARSARLIMRAIEKGDIEGMVARLAEQQKGRKLDALDEKLRSLDRDESRAAQRSAEVLQHRKNMELAKAKVELQRAEARSRLPETERVAKAVESVKQKRSALAKTLERRRLDKLEEVKKAEAALRKIEPKAEAWSAKLTDLTRRYEDLLAVEAKFPGRNKSRTKQISSLERRIGSQEKRIESLSDRQSKARDRLEKANREASSFEKTADEARANLERILESEISNAVMKGSDARVRAQRSYNSKVKKLNDRFLKLAEEQASKRASVRQKRVQKIAGQREALLQSQRPAKQWTDVQVDRLYKATARELADIERALEGHIQVKNMLKDPQSLKRNGAWLELDGKVVGGPQAAAHALRRVREGASVTEVFEDMVVRGDNPDAVRVMELAQEPLRMLSEQDHYLMQKGVISPSRFAANLGRNLLAMVSPERALEFTPAKVARDPALALVERSNLVSHLQYVEDVASLPGVTFPKVSSNIAEFDRARKVGGETVRAGKLPDGTRVVQIPEKIDVAAGLRYPKYGDLAGRWVAQDTLEAMQQVIGARANNASRLSRLFKKTRVLNNLRSLVNMNLGNAISMAWDGINPAKLGSALGWMAGKGSEVDKVFTQAARHRGVYEGASVHALEGIAKEPGGLHKFIDNAIEHSATTDKASQISEALLKGADWASDNVFGMGGSIRWAWEQTDKAFRLATLRAQVERLAPDFGLDVRTVDGMRAAMSNEKLMGAAMLKTLNDTLDYQSVPRGPRVGGKGVYQWAADSGAMPFIVYPLKAGGLWSRRIADNPGRFNISERAGQASWDQLEDSERKQRMQFDAFGEGGWNIWFGNSRVKARNMQPIAHLLVDTPVEFDQRGLESVAPMLMVPLAEAIKGETLNGQRIWEDGDTATFKAAASAYHIISSAVIPPTTQQILPQPGAKRQGFVEVLSEGAILDVDTGLKAEIPHLVARFFVNVDPQAKQKIQSRVDFITNEYGRNTSRAWKLLGQNGNQKMYEETLQRAELKMAKELGELAASLENR